jgi:hypothetical protein
VTAQQARKNNRPTVNASPKPLKSKAAMHSPFAKVIAIEGRKYISARPSKLDRQRKNHWGPNAQTRRTIAMQAASRIRIIY